MVRSGDDFNADGAGDQRPDRPTGNVPRSFSANQWITGNTVRANMFPLPPTSDIRNGTLPRDYFRGPGFAKLDASLSKSFPVPQRVRHGIFESNELLGNGRHGVSIGHNGTDNLLRKNLIRGNATYGIYFRNETESLAGHRNRLEENRIEDNGGTTGGAGIVVDGETREVVIRRNLIRDTRPAGARMQRTAIRLGDKVGKIDIVDNDVVAGQEIEDRRREGDSGK